MDRDQGKIESIRKSQAPFFEPGLEELISANVAARPLVGHRFGGPGRGRCRYLLLCVGTPSERNGNLGLDQLRRVTEDIRAALAARTTKKKLIVAVRSTVFSGHLRAGGSAHPGRPGRHFDCVEPQFLREGSAVVDFR